MPAGLEPLRRTLLKAGAMGMWKAVRRPVDARVGAGGVFIPGQPAGYGLASLVGARRVARWERRHRSRLAFHMVGGRPRRYDALPSPLEAGRRRRRTPAGLSCRPKPAARQAARAATRPSAAGHGECRGHYGWSINIGA